MEEKLASEKTHSEYRRKIERGFEHFKNSQVVTKTLEELEAMENE